jgi:SepF-like predicted cell division protein (DUF552 family)
MELVKMKFTVQYNEMVRRMVTIEAGSAEEAMQLVNDGNFNIEDVTELESWDPEVEEVIEEE